MFTAAVVQGECRAAEQRDELASFHHSITSSARPSSVGGTVYFPPSD